LSRFMECIYCMYRAFLGLRQRAIVSVFHGALGQNLIAELNRKQRLKSV
jgi:hypothetical protein